MTTTPTSPSASGRHEERDGAPYLVFERTFRAPAEAVWAAITEPGRLERWIGTWSGDPASGAVTFRMTAEGDDVPEETITIDSCEPPTRLVMRSVTPDDPDRLWRWDVELTEAAGVTTLTFAQEVTDPEVAESVGPGWDYYLDRLVAAEAGGDVAALAWDDYFPALRRHYRDALSRRAT